MNIVQSSGKLMIYGDAIKVYDKIPVGSYEVEKSPLSGFYLHKRTDLQVNEKIYGDAIHKTDKVMKSFAKINRNFGVILSGRKGIGKSIFARVLANKCLENDVPVIMVNQYDSGIASFISSIEQTVCVIFDEYDKTFYDEENYDAAQNELLPLFDGIDNGKKLFVITCNDIGRLSEFIRNRPGRFHYHFELKQPGDEEIREYMKDSLEPEFQFNIENVIKLSMMIDFTYDYLRALCFELNQGYELNEALKDLNISSDESTKYLITAYDSKGNCFSGDCSINFLSRDRTFRVHVFNSSIGYRYRIEFDLDKLLTDGNGVYEAKQFRFKKLENRYDDWDDEDGEDTRSNDTAEEKQQKIERVYLQKYMLETRFVV